MALRATIALTLALSLAGCGDDGSGTPADATVQPADSAVGPDGNACSQDLAPTDDGTGIAVDLVLSEVDPGNFIELYNNTDSPITLADVDHQLCSPFVYRALASEAPQVTVPPRGRAQIPWPSNFTTDNDDAGELQLFSSANFTNSSDIVDFLCWGPARGSSRKSQAESVGKWDSGADCAAAIPANGSLERVMSSTGTGASSYAPTATPTPENCE